MVLPRSRRVARVANGGGELEPPRVDVLAQPRGGRNLGVAEVIRDDVARVDGPVGCAGRERAALRLAELPGGSERWLRHRRIGGKEHRTGECTNRSKSSHGSSYRDGVPSPRPTLHIRSPRTVPRSFPIRVPRYIRQAQAKDQPECG